MIRIALIGLLAALSISSFGQGVHRFINGSARDVLSGLPIIEGYSDSDSITDFQAALDEYILDALLEANEKTDVIINGSCRVLITFDSNTVKSVEIIELNSTVFARQVQGILYALPIESHTYDLMAVTHTVNQPIGCCIKGKLNIRPLADSDTASKRLTAFFRMQALNIPDTMRWLVRTNTEGQIDCIAFSPNSYLEWNDVLLKNLEVIEENLPNERGQWIVKYDPRMLEYTSLRAVRETETEPAEKTSN
ncbi:MAG: hypothetical protein HWE14_10150 [Flavobacteriia bacterium]|nr:hypothetical protein [Flavobacteriia bacterium]